MERLYGLYLISLTLNLKTNEGQVRYPVFNLNRGPDLYREFAKKFNRTFVNREEHQMRYKNFMKTLQEINFLNSQPGSVKVGPNKYADLTDIEKINYEVDQNKPAKMDEDLANIQDSYRVNVADVFRFDLK